MPLHAVAVRVQPSAGAINRAEELIKPAMAKQTEQNMLPVLALPRYVSVCTTTVPAELSKPVKTGKPARHVFKNFRDADFVSEFPVLDMSEPRAIRGRGTHEKRPVPGKRNLAAKISQLPLQCPLESREDPDGRYWTREDITNPYDHLARGMPYSADTFLRLDILEKLKGQSEVAVLSVFIRVAIVKSGDDWRPWSAAKDKIARDPSPLAS